MTPVLADCSGSAELVLTEPEGVDLRVRVETPDGRPVPSAEIEARCTDWTSDLQWGYEDVVRGVQTGVLLTDADGELVLRHLPPDCSVDVSARQGSRDARERADPGGELRLVLD